MSNRITREDEQRLRIHYMEQLPMVAALLLQTQEDEEDFEGAVEDALDLIEASIEIVANGRRKKA